MVGFIVCNVAGNSALKRLGYACKLQRGMRKNEQNRNLMDRPDMEPHKRMLKGESGVRSLLRRSVVAQVGQVIRGNVAPREVKGSQENSSRLKGVRKFYE
jgi:hypothetical protein